MTNTLMLGAAFQRGLLPVSARRARAGHHPERRGRGEEPERLRVGTGRGGRPGGARPRDGRPERRPGRARALRARARAGERGGGRRPRRAPAPGGGADTGARGLPGARRTPLGTPRPCAGCRWPSRSARPDTTSWPGGGAQPPQADGLQGRVRGGPTAPRRVRARPHEPGAGRRRKGLVQPPSAAAARAGHEAQAQAGPLVRARPPDAPVHAPAARHPAGSLRAGARAADGARPDRRVRAPRGVAPSPRSPPSRTGPRWSWPSFPT